MAVIGRINTIISATTKPLTTGLNRAGTAISRFSGGLTGMVGKLGPLAAGLTGGAALFKGISDAADFEQAEIAFGTLLGSTEKAKQVIGDLSTFAAETPFEMPQLTGAARNLAAFGIESENIVPTLRRIGDISSGIGAPIDEIAELYGKAKVQGRLFANDINQLTGRGIPIITELAKQFGVSESKVMKLVERGKVGFPQIQKAFESMTNEGGKFAGLMDAQSQSLSGLWSTAKDGISLVFRDIAQLIIDTFDFKAGIGSLSTFTDSARSGIKSITPIFKQFGNTVRAGFQLIGDTATSVYNALGLGGGSTFSQIKDFAFDAFAVMEFAFQNVGPIAALMWEKIKLGAVTTWENLKHLFGTQIPTVISWLAGNWRDIFTTIFDFTTTVFINLGKNIRSAMKQIWDFIKSGGRKSLNITWTPLTEGFKNAVKELPDIPDRAMSELEKKLTTNVQTMGGDLSEKLGEHLAMRRGELLEEAKTPEFQEIIPETASKVEVGMTDQLAGKLSDLEGVAAVQRGSGDAFSAIFKAMRGESQADKQLKAQEQQLKEQKQQTAALKKIVKNPPVQLVAGEV